MFICISMESGILNVPKLLSYNQHFKDTKGFFMVKDGEEITFQVLMPGKRLVFYSSFSGQSASIPAVATFKIKVSHKIKCLNYKYTF